MTYHEQLKHPEWQKKRLETLEYYGYQCQWCKSTDKELHVHHTFYRKNAKVWEYSTLDLRVLCKDCHAEEHELDEIVKEAVFSLDPQMKRRIVGYVHSLVGLNYRGETEDYRTGFIDALRKDDSLLELILKNLR